MQARIFPLFRVRCPSDHLSIGPSQSQASSFWYHLIISERLALGTGSCPCSRLHTRTRARRPASQTDNFNQHDDDDDDEDDDADANESNNFFACSLWLAASLISLTPLLPANQLISECAINFGAIAAANKSVPPEKRQIHGRIHTLLEHQPRPKLADVRAVTRPSLCSGTTR